MALSDYQPDSREIKLKDTTFRVEGLSLNHLAVLIRTHLPDLEALFDLFEHAEKITPQGVQSVVESIVMQAPGFAANVIALASGEENAQDTAARLPFPVQIEAIVAIGDLTFTEVGGVKKALEAVARLLKAAGLKDKMVGQLDLLTATRKAG